MSNCSMSHRAADLSVVQTLVQAPVNAGFVRGEARYPRQLVLWGLLSFCLSAWTGVAVAVAHFV